MNNQLHLNQVVEVKVRKLSSRLCCDNENIFKESLGHFNGRSETTGTMIYFWKAVLILPFFLKTKDKHFPLHSDTIKQIHFDPLLQWKKKRETITNEIGSSFTAFSTLWLQVRFRGKICWIASFHKAGGGRSFSPANRAMEGKSFLMCLSSSVKPQAPRRGRWWMRRRRGLKEILRKHSVSVFKSHCVFFKRNDSSVPRVFLSVLTDFCPVGFDSPQPFAATERTRQRPAAARGQK